MKAIDRDDASWESLQQLAERCGVTTLGVDGAYGHMIGSASDGAVLREYARKGRFAERTVDLIRSFLGDRGGTYVDVGANIGMTTVPIAQLAGVRCIAIEPSPTNFSHLAANVGMNCPPGRVELHRRAVSAKRGTLTLELSPHNSGDNRLRLQNERSGKLGESEWHTVPIEAAPLDEFVVNPSRPLVVKIDVQGAEPFVVEGAGRTLDAADLVIIEWAPYWLASVGGDVGAVTTALCQRFAQLSIADLEESPIEPPAPARSVAARLLELYEQHRHEPVRYMDIIARRH